MRVSHLMLLILIVAVAIALAREPAGRAAMIVFLTGLGVVTLALVALMTLFQTVGSLGEARGLAECCEALIATSLVLVLGAASVSGWLAAGLWILFQFA